MKKYACLSFLFLLPCSAGANKKPKPLPMPPLTSHGQPISKYACDFTEEPETSFDEYYYWRVVAYAEYGDEHKRYWSKGLGTYKGTAALTGHQPESAANGKVIGLMNETVYLGDAQKKCAEWKTAVHQMLEQTQKK